MSFYRAHVLVDTGTPAVLKGALALKTALIDEIKKKGVDAIACVAVNDVFVMNAWGEQQGASNKVMMLADGNGELTRALGLEMDATKYGMGKRSQRFSMLVENGVVKQLNVEEPGAYVVSSAEYMLKQI